MSDILKWMENSIVDELLLIVVFVAISESIAQNQLKNSNIGSIRFIIGLLFYIVVGYLLHYAYHKFPLGKVNVIWSCLSIIIAVTLGYLLYDEPFNQWSLYSIVFALSAIICTFKD